MGGRSIGCGEAKLAKGSLIVSTFSLVYGDFKLNTVTVKK